MCAAGFVDCSKLLSRDEFKLYALPSALPELVEGMTIGLTRLMVHIIKIAFSIDPNAIINLFELKISFQKTSSLESSVKYLIEIRSGWRFNVGNVSFIEGSQRVLRGKYGYLVTWLWAKPNMQVNTLHITSRLFRMVTTNVPRARDLCIRGVLFNQPSLFRHSGKSDFDTRPSLNV
jgi:hypothetical protein